MRRKLWPKAPVKKGACKGCKEISKKFQVYFINIYFFKKPNKKTYNRAKELYCVATIFIFDSILSTSPKKMQTEK